MTSHGVLRLTRDGLITFNGPSVGEQIEALHLAFDPLTYDPRPQ